MIGRALLGIACGGLFALLAWAMAEMPARPEGLVQEALRELPKSGVEHPVTAVLLNYRGYDTLLEVAVLLLALVGVWSAMSTRPEEAEIRPPPLLLAMVRITLPVILVAAGYLLWVGAFAPGGAFQGGALVGGALVLLFLAGLSQWVWARKRALRLGLSLGVAVFAAVAALTMTQSGYLLGYPDGTAGMWILAIESAALVSIGLTLGLLFLGGRPADPMERESHES